MNDTRMGFDNPVTEEQRELAQGWAEATAPKGGQLDVHPIFQAACRAFSGDTARAAANAPVMREYMVRFIRGGVVERQFEAMGEDPVVVAERHEGIANGAKVDVMTIERYRTHYAPTQFPAQPVRMSSEDNRFTEREVDRMQAREALAWGPLL